MRQRLRGADCVVRRIYVEENIPHEVFTKESFYGLFAALAPEMKNGPLKPKTLYYHIKKYHSKWKDEREKRRKEMPRSALVPLSYSFLTSINRIIRKRSICNFL